VKVGANEQETLDKIAALAFPTQNEMNEPKEKETGDEELDAILKGVEQEKASEEAVKAQYDETLNEAKKKEEKNYSVQQVNPTELRLGIKTELEYGNMELDKAKEIAYKNITKDPIYYTTLKLSGLEAHPKKVKGEKVAPIKKAKKESAQLVDLVNAMQKVKMPKAEEKKKLKENQLNEGGEYTFIGRLNSAELKKIHEIIPDIEIDVEQDDDMERTTVTSKFYNNKFIEQAVDGVINPPKSTMRPGVDMGASFEKMKKSMEEIIRETVSEYFDGRDNLVNPLSAEEENK
jgi:hypothetical protein